MQKSRKKKRLVTTAIVFMLTFVVGAAFAFAPGMLDIVGTVNITTTEDYVRWYTVDYGDGWRGPGAAPDGITGAWGSLWTEANFASIVTTDELRPVLVDAIHADPPINDGRMLQRITWTMHFDAASIAEYGISSADPARAGITATAFNHSPQDAEISMRPYRWRGTGMTPEAADALATALGLSVDILEDDTDFPFVGVLASGEESMPLTVNVEWDGSIPEGDIPAQIRNPLYTPENDEPVFLPGFSLELIIEFDYVLAQ